MRGWFRSKEFCDPIFIAMLNYYARHKISSDVEVIPIQQVNQAYGRMVRGDVAVSVCD
jgi:D-arabinose 1-dehydrogenase-like Zn-dependent alcohol dehydrogenase